MKNVVTIDMSVPIKVIVPPSDLNIIQIIVIVLIEFTTSSGRVKSEGITNPTINSVTPEEISINEIM